MKLKVRRRACFEVPFWKIGSKGRSSSRVQIASNCFKLIPMFLDRGPHLMCSKLLPFNESRFFFKASPFLSACSVIHAMSDEQDMRKMGKGLASSLPFNGSKILL